MLRAAQVAPSTSIAELKRSAKIKTLNSNDEIPASVKSTLDAMNKTKPKGYGFGGRVAFFTFVTAVILGLSAALYFPFAIGASLSAGSGGGNSPLAVIPFLALVSILVSGVLIFKK